MGLAVVVWTFKMLPTVLRPKFPVLFNLVQSGDGLVSTVSDLPCAMFSLGVPKLFHFSSWTPWYPRLPNSNFAVFGAET